MVKAIDTFDLLKEKTFSTYASRCIDNEILMFLRKLKKDKNVDSLDEIVNHNKIGSGSSEIKIEDTIIDNINIIEEYENNEICDIVYQIISELPEMDKNIILMYFGFINDEIYTQRKIADKYNMKQYGISRLINKILAKIRYELLNKGIIELNNQNKDELCKVKILKNKK